MFSCTKSALLYGIFSIVIMFLMLYIWRRIYGLECYTQILEKKIINLKKENKQLQENHCNFASDCDAEIIMNKIFSTGPIDPTGPTDQTGPTDPTGSENVQIDSHPSVRISFKSEKDSDMILKNIIEEGLSTSEKELDTNDIESVISDITTPYNKKKLSKMNLDKLKDICTEMNLSTEGTRNILIDRIITQ